MGISRLISLKYIDIGYNKFKGTIPVDLFSINGLETVYVEYNLLTGTIPSMHADMSKLSTLCKFDSNIIVVS